MTIAKAKIENILERMPATIDVEDLIYQLYLFPPRSQAPAWERTCIGSSGFLFTAHWFTRSRSFSHIVGSQAGAWEPDSRGSTVQG